MKVQAPGTAVWGLIPSRILVENCDFSAADLIWIEDVLARRLIPDVGLEFYGTSEILDEIEACLAES